MSRQWQSVLVQRSTLSMIVMSTNQILMVSVPPKWVKTPNDESDVLDSHPHHETVNKTEVKNRPLNDTQSPHCSRGTTNDQHIKTKAHTNRRGRLHLVIVSGSQSRLHVRVTFVECVIDEGADRPYTWNQCTHKKWWRRCVVVLRFVSVFDSVMRRWIFQTICPPDESGQNVLLA